MGKLIRRLENLKKAKKIPLQKDLYGQNVHIALCKETCRMVKCGRCGTSVKSSQAKTHLSFGNELTLCNECLKKGGNIIPKNSNGKNGKIVSVEDIGKIQEVKILGSNIDSPMMTIPEGIH